MVGIILREICARMRDEARASGVVSRLHSEPDARSSQDCPVARKTVRAVPCRDVRTSRSTQSIAP